MIADPLAHVPGIWRPCLAVELNGTPGRLLKMNPGPGANWFADVGPGYQSGVDRILAEAWGRKQLQPKILLDDPTGATTGCLAAFCRGVYQDACMYALCNPGEEPGDPAEWQIRIPARHGSHMCSRGPTEAAAWRNAILVHPSLLEL